MLRQFPSTTGGCLLLSPNSTAFQRPASNMMQGTLPHGTSIRTSTDANSALNGKRPPPSSVMEWAARGSSSDEDSSEDALEGSLTSMQWLQNLRLPMHGGGEAPPLAFLGGGIPGLQRQDTASEPDIDCDDDMDSDLEKRTLPSPQKDGCGLDSPTKGEMDGAVPDGSDEIDEIYRRHGHNSGYAKPPHSYASLITHAISTSGDKRMSLSEIYDWVILNYPFYKHAGNGWKNSIRHNLSLNKCFVKVARPDDKTPCWTMNPNFQSAVEKVSNKHLQVMQSKKSPIGKQQQQQLQPQQPQQQQQQTQQQLVQQPAPKQVAKVKRPIRQMSNPLVPTEDGGQRDPSTGSPHTRPADLKAAASPAKQAGHVPAVGRALHPLQMQALAAQIAAQQAQSKPKRRQSKPSLKQQASVDSLQLSASSLASSSGSITKPRRRGSQQRSSVSSVRSSIDLSQLSLSGADIDALSQSNGGDLTSALSDDSPNPLLFSDFALGAQALPDDFNSADPRFAANAARSDGFDPLDAVLGDCNMLLTSSWGPTAPSIQASLQQHALSSAQQLQQQQHSQQSQLSQQQQQHPILQLQHAQGQHSQGGLAHGQEVVLPHSDAFIQAFDGGDGRLSLSGSGAARFAAEFLADDGIIDCFDWTSVM
eukprot:Opistho-2@91393